MTTATQQAAIDPVRRNDITNHLRPARRSETELMVATPSLPTPVQARLTSLARQHGCSLSFAPPNPTVDCDLLRLETAAGLPMTDQRARSCWHRPPYALALRLMHYDNASRHGVPLDTAVVGTTGSRTHFLNRITRVTERLIADAICHVSRGAPGISFDSAAADTSMLPPPIDRARAVWHARLFSEWWSIGSTEISLRDILDDETVAGVRWIAPKRGTAYLADPFPWPQRDAVLCEEMPFAGGTGRIVALPLAAHGAPQAVDVVLEDGVHHSYPCSFRENGGVYLLPESTDRGATRLYRFSPQSRPEPICSIAPDMRLADPTLFRHDGRYWIACTDLDFGEHDNLCLLYADHLTGPWHFHRCQPVKIDICGARPAGTPFVLDGQLFRPGQDCASGYGAGVVIHRIDVLTPDHFQETVVTRLRPDPAGPFPDGLHTLTADSRRIWIDGKRYVFDPVGVCRKLIRRIGLGTVWSRRSTK